MISWHKKIKDELKIKDNKLRTLLLIKNIDYKKCK